MPRRRSDKRATRKQGKDRSVRRVQTGVEEWINPQTGERAEIPKFLITGGDFNFEKTWVWHLCDAYELVGNKSVDVLNYLVEARNSENIIIASQRKIADSLGIGLSTVSRTLRLLLEENIISMPQQGVYRLSPAVMWRGEHTSRMKILYEYSSEKAEERRAKPKEQLREEKKKRVDASIQRLEEELRGLQTEREMLSMPSEESAAE